ncbi:MAG: EVE domain-containing protein [Opitutaceae bacterium]|jgi:predicted RNA-binding protein with PUA-like domain|nr:EVE domain-containing protein [Opitutaceae bacterium]NBR58154.1 EVE domain-containing protein [Opitutaceae bacterium]
MTTQYWLVKSEPSAYAWTDLVRDQRTAWTGVRNYAARLHLKTMQKGDEVFFYHSIESKSIVGLARVTKTFFPDPTAPNEDWAAVELTAVAPLAQPVTLAQIKADEKLQQIALVRQSRLSVMPLQPAEFARIKKLGGI